MCNEQILGTEAKNYEENLVNTDLNVETGVGSSRHGH